jgi:hypothetical protein
MAKGLTAGEPSVQQMIMTKHAVAVFDIHLDQASAQSFPSDSKPL